MTTQYAILKATSERELESRVNDHLKKGWALHGCTFFKRGVCLQVMVLKPPKGPPRTPTPPKSAEDTKGAFRNGEGWWSRLVRRLRRR